MAFLFAISFPVRVVEMVLTCAWQKQFVAYSFLIWLFSNCNLHLDGGFFCVQKEWISHWVCWEFFMKIQLGYAMTVMYDRLHRYVTVVFLNGFNSFFSFYCMRKKIVTDLISRTARFFTLQVACMENLPLIKLTEIYVKQRFFLMFFKRFSPF